MPLSERQRRILTSEHMGQYYPDATPQQVRLVTELCVVQFVGNYSPLELEQDEPLAAGTGVNFEEFIIDVGRIVTGQEPVGIDRVWLGSILLRCLM